MPFLGWRVNFELCATAVGCQEPTLMLALAPTPTARLWFCVLCVVCGCKGVQCVVPCAAGAPGFSCSMCNGKCTAGSRDKHARISQQDRSLLGQARGKRSASRIIENQFLVTPLRRPHGPTLQFILVTCHTSSMPGTIVTRHTSSIPGTILKADF